MNNCFKNNKSSLFENRHLSGPCETLQSIVTCRLEEEPLMQAFNVYVQILVSQALEPGFLSAIKSEEGEFKNAKLVNAQTIHNTFPLDCYYVTIKYHFSNFKNICLFKGNICHCFI